MMNLNSNSSGSNSLGSSQAAPFHVASAGELVLEPVCRVCSSNNDLYGSSCRHLTLCPPCGKSMAESGAACSECGVPVTRLIREYNVKAPPSNAKQYFMGRFLQGVPIFLKKKAGDARWTMHREGLQGRQLTESQKEKFKAKPWLLEDEQGQTQYQGHLEGAQQASYYLLMMHGKDFLAMPAGSWHAFNKVAQYKQLTLEEAEEQMKNRRKTAEGYQRWMMKAASTGAAAFGEVDKVGGGGGGGGSRGRQRKGDDDDDAVLSDRGEEDEDDEEARKNRLGMNKKTGDDDGEDPARADDHDLDDDEPEKGDDWEHEETFTDDDEAVGIEADEREDQGPELPAPPEIKQEEDDEDEEALDEEGRGLSKSGRELKKLLGKSAGLDESDDEFEDDDEDADIDNEDNPSPVLAPNRSNAPKEEPAETTPSKASASASRNQAAGSTTSKGKRKVLSDDVKPPAPQSSKKQKVESEDVKTPVTVKREAAVSASASASASAKVPSSSSPAKVTTPAASLKPVTEEEVKAILKQTGPITSQDLVAKFKTRLRSHEDKQAFAAILKRISRIQKVNGQNFIVLRER